MNVDVTPDPEEIVQAEEEYGGGAPVKVVVCGPTETRELPAVRAGYMTAQDITDTVAIRLLPFEPRRKGALLVALDQDIWLSGSQAGAQSGAAGAMRIPAVVPWPINHLDEVWVCAVTGTTDVGVQADYWSE